MRRLFAVAAGLATLTACPGLVGMHPDQPCLEAGYAISSRTFDCSDDGDLANARYERFVDQLACIPHPLEEEQGAKLNPQVDLFHCAYVIRTLGCTDVDDFGDDPVAWMSVSPACNLVATYANGDPLPAYDGFAPAPTQGEPECSDEEGPPAVFTIANTGSSPLTLYWLTPGACSEQFYYTLTAFSEPLVQSTSEGHVWVVRDTNGKLITWFRAEDGLQVQVP